MLPTFQQLPPLRHRMVYDAAYVGHLGDYRCANRGAARLPLDVAARDWPRRTDRFLVPARDAGRHDADRAATPRALQRLQRAGRRVVAAFRALGASLNEIKDELAGFSAAFGGSSTRPATAPC